MKHFFFAVLLFCLPLLTIAQEHETVVSKSQVKDFFLKSGHNDTLFVRIKLQNPHKISHFSLRAICEDSVVVGSGFTILRTTSNDPIDALYYFVHRNASCGYEFGEEFRIFDYPEYDFEITWEIVLTEQLNRNILSVYCEEFYDIDEIRYLEEWRAKGNHVGRRINQVFGLFSQSLAYLKSVEVGTNIIKIVQKSKKKK